MPRNSGNCKETLLPHSGISEALMSHGVFLRVLRSIIRVLGYFIQDWSFDVLLPGLRFLNKDRSKHLG